MFLRRGATLGLMAVLLLLGFAILSGCDDSEVQKAHLPPNIGTDPATGGQAPVVTLTGQFASAVSSAPANGGPQTFTTLKGVVLALSCSPDPADCGANRAESPFSCQAEAQAYSTALALATGRTDCAGLDGDGDGLACNGSGLNLPATCP